MSVFCQPIFRGTIGRITMTHRPQSLDDCAPTLKHYPISMSLRKQGFVEPLAKQRSLTRVCFPSLKPMGFTGYLIKKPHPPSSRVGFCRNHRHINQTPKA